MIERTIKKQIILSIKSKSITLVTCARQVVSLLFVMK